MHSSSTKDSKVIDDWISYIKEKMIMLGITHDNICNFDETNIYFSFISKNTVNIKGTRTIYVARAPTSSRCTVMLGVSVTNYKFPSYIIYKDISTARGFVMKELWRFTAIETKPVLI